MTDDCFAPTAGLISAVEARARLKAAAKCLVDIEQVPLADACGRTLAESIVSQVDVPPCANAAVDGYAIAHADLSPYASTRLPISITVAAGAQPRRLTAGTTARILTGAPLPVGADTVVMQEDVDVTAEGVLFKHDVKQGINWRPAGEDVAAGAEVLSAGTRLRAADIGMAAALGVGELTVFKPLDIAVLSTGDEIVAVGNEPQAGKRFDANGPMLAAFLRSQGHRVTNLGIVPDDPERVAAAFTSAARLFQVIISSGGASTSDADHVVGAVRRLGAIDVWRLAIKPGRPFAFGRVADTPFIGLPGNPVAVGVCAMMFATPFLNVLAGQSWRLPQSYPLAANFSMTKKPGRTEWLRAKLVETDSGLAVERHSKQGSGVLSSLVEADGLVELPDACEIIRADDMVSFIPLDQF